MTDTPKNKSESDLLTEAESIIVDSALRGRLKALKYLAENNICRADNLNRIGNIMRDTDNDDLRDDAAMILHKLTNGAGTESGNLTKRSFRYRKTTDASPESASK